MKRIAILIIAALAYIPMMAHAQTAPIVTKSPPSAIQQTFSGYANGGSGFYFGLNTMGSAAAVNGAATPGTVVAQGDVGLTLGYGGPLGNVAGNFWFAEGRFDWANLNGATSGFSLTGPAHFEQRLALGSPISTLLNLFPSLTSDLSVPSLPALPIGVTAGPSYPFLFASVHEQDVSGANNIAGGRAWLVSPGVGIGLQSRLSNGVVAEVAAQWVLQSSSLNIGAQKVSFGNEALVSLDLKY